MLGPVIAAFDPQLVLVSAGFDAVEGDPLVSKLTCDCPLCLSTFTLRDNVLRLP